VLELNKIHLGDCLELMKEIPDKTVDIFTDTIYNVNKDYGPYCNDNLPEDEYIEKITRVLNEIKRIGINIAVYIPKKWNLLFWNILGPEFREIILPFRHAGAIRHGFSNQFNKILTNSQPIQDLKNVWENMPQPAMGYYFRENTYGNPGYTSLAITDKAVFELLHSDIILDPFIGTGTTAIAALKNKKSFIGIDINPNQVGIANQRVNDYKSQTKMEFEKVI